MSTVELTRESDGPGLVAALAEQGLTAEVVDGPGTPRRPGRGLRRESARGPRHRGLARASGRSDSSRCGSTTAPTRSRRLPARSSYTDRHGNGRHEGRRPRAGTRGGDRLGEITPGTVLRQEQLSEQYPGLAHSGSGGATTSRCARGLVSLRPTRGGRVRTLSREELREAFLVRRRAREPRHRACHAADHRRGAGGAGRGGEAFREADARVTGAVRAKGTQDGALGVASWVWADHAFHDVVYAAADAPFVERLAKSARRSFFSHVVWGRGPRHRPPVRAGTMREHRAIREAIAATQRPGRPLARP